MSDKRPISSQLAGRVSHKHLTRGQYLKEVCLTWGMIVQRIFVYLSFGTFLRWTYRRAERNGLPYFVDRTPAENLASQRRPGSA